MEARTSQQSQSVLCPASTLVRSQNAEHSVSCALTNPFLANLSKREILSLYGLRGIAALAVVFFHYLDQWKYDRFLPGPYALTLFFELSRLLITWVLLGDIFATRRLDHLQFFLLRSLRLFPVFYVVWF